MQAFQENVFRKYSNFIYENFGIYLNEEKKELLQSKLLKLMMKHKTASYEAYFNLLTQSGNREILVEFANEITINKTDFFREINHFEFIKKNSDLILERNKRIRRNSEIRVWSAGCSTGEEAYTLAMVLQEHFLPGLLIKILATDLNSKVVSQAMKGVYPSSIKGDMDILYLSKYFEKVQNEWYVTESTKRLVTFRLFNLMDDFPFKKLFDFIFCRNVMIYFDSKTQQRLIDKFYEVLAPGGLLFIGHSESLTNKKHKYQYIQPTIYMK
ncbi:MAG: protein-glutamate O-methyltransferase CheR [Clostridia bacterium]|nr:protein-glutamate O-methyltransferase CheR [Clostridia bacterium]